MFHMIPHDLGGHGRQAAGDAVGQFFDMILTDLRVSQMHQDLGMVRRRNHWKMVRHRTGCRKQQPQQLLPLLFP